MNLFAYGRKKVLWLSANNKGDVRSLLSEPDAVQDEQRDVVKTRIGERIEFAERGALRRSELVVAHDAIMGNDAD